MSSHTDGDKTSRRDFLKIAATTLPASAAAVALAPDSAEAAPVDPISDKMQDTAHTRAYLDSARF